MTDINVLHAMREAVDKGNCARAQQLLHQYPDLRLGAVPYNSYGLSWLHWAARGNSVEMVQLLLDAGIPVDVLDQDYETPLCKAACNCAEPSIASLLLEKGANPDGHPKHESSPLHQAVIYGLGTTLIPLMVAHGASVEVRDAQNRTPLMMAAWDGKIDALKQLLAAGADLFAVGGKNSDWSVFDFAEEGGAKEAKSFLWAYTQGLRANQAIVEADKLFASGSHISSLS